MAANERKILRCAVYTRKSSEHGLEQDFNSLDAQREAAEAYIKSQAHEGWRLVKARYDDGGLSGGTLERRALQSLLDDIRSRKVDVVVVYKVDRLTRSLAGFVSQLRADLDQRGVRSRQRVLTSGRVLGGCSFGRGALYHLLQNSIYRGEVVHKGIAYPGEHKAIVDEELWSAVQARLVDNRTTRRKSRAGTGALLGGLIFRDRGNNMSPTYALRRGHRYHHY